MISDHDKQPFMTPAWPHKWFGTWREQDPRFADFPSVYDWVQPGVQIGERELEYLANAPVLAATSWMALPCVICGYGEGSLCSRTDGTWHWMDDLPHYIREHSLALPEELLAHMRAVDFRLPTFTTEELMAIVRKLERPPVRS
jgi:hypothetical protein